MTWISLRCKASRQASYLSINSAYITHRFYVYYLIINSLYLSIYFFNLISNRLMDVIWFVWARIWIETTREVYQMYTFYIHLTWNTFKFLSLPSLIKSLDVESVWIQATLPVGARLETRQRGRKKIKERKFTKLFESYTYACNLATK